MAPASSGTTSRRTARSPRTSGCASHPARSPPGPAGELPTVTVGCRSPGQGRAQLRDGLRAIDAARAVCRARHRRRRPRRPASPVVRSGCSSTTSSSTLLDMADAPLDRRARSGWPRRWVRTSPSPAIACRSSPMAPGRRRDAGRRRRSRRGTACGRASPRCTATRPGSALAGRPRRRRLRVARSDHDDPQHLGGIRSWAGSVPASGTIPARRRLPPRWWVNAVLVG